ncbi:MAG TPA: hypothetical protein VHR38_09875 [Solirubrobacterales bacterium]|jgi:hypothetical protein|nr:hypothetical protein [Solirubrobacterales bacterium]
MPLLASLQLGTVFIIVVLVALPLGALVFAMGAGNALEKIGKGDFALEQDFPQSSDGSTYAVSPEVREEEIRQMVQARSDRAVAKGRQALDVEAEVRRLLASDVGGPSLGGDRALREEVRQLVVARNERRQRQGKEPLDVESEVERQLRDLESLGQ